MSLVVLRWLIPVFLLLATVFPVSAGSAPRVRLENVRQIEHNGEHNAFTDLVRWRGRFWLTFRSCPDGHMVHPTSSIRILSSKDAENWKEVHRFSVSRRDTRDPHFLVFGDRLFVYTGTWWSGEETLPREDYNLNQHLGYAVFSEDGESWSEPKQLEGTYGHYIWRAAVHKGKAYLCGRRKLGYSEQEGGAGATRVVQSAMLESDDGLVWRFHSLFQEDRGDETAFLFEADGALLAVSRSGSQPAQLVRAKPPWREKTRKDFQDYIGGPLLVRWGDRYLVGGRRQTREGPRTALYWLIGDELIRCLELPSAGDNSYPGFVELDEGRGLISWYSSHQRDAEGKPITAVYVGDLVLEESVTGKR